MKYSILLGVSGHHDGHNTVDRLTEQHFPRRMARTEKKCILTSPCFVCSKHNTIRKTVSYCKGCDVVVGVYRCFEAYHTSKNTAVM